MSNTLRETTWKDRLKTLAGSDDVQFVISKMYLKIGDVAISDMWESIENFITSEIETARRDGREEMRKECLKYFTNGQCGNMEELYYSISSLK